MRIQHALMLSLLAAPLSAQVATTTTPPTTASTVKPFTPAETERYIALGKRAASFMLKVQPESLIAMMPAENATAMGGVAGAQEQMLKMKERMGSMVKVLAEKMTRREGKPQFWFEADYTDFTDEPVVMRFVFTEDGKLVGLGINPKSAAKFDS